MCDHRYLNEPDGLLCDNANCDGRGHTYTASRGPDLSDDQEDDQ